MERKNAMKNNYHLSMEQKKDMIDTIQQYFWEEKQEKLGDLAASLLLDFFARNLADVFYNKGVEDAYAFYSNKLDDVFEIQK